MPAIYFHDLRHVDNTLVQDLKVPPRDAQIILGHANVTTTQQIYTKARELHQVSEIREVCPEPRVGNAAPRHPVTAP